MLQGDEQRGSIDQGQDEEYIPQRVRATGSRAGA
jgi:hypothetical protein